MNITLIRAADPSVKTDTQTSSGDGKDSGFSDLLAGVMNSGGNQAPGSISVSNDAGKGQQSPCTQDAGSIGQHQQAEDPSEKKRETDKEDGQNGMIILLPYAVQVPASSAAETAVSALPGQQITDSSSIAAVSGAAAESSAGGQGAGLGSNGGSTAMGAAAAEESGAFFTQIPAARTLPEQAKAETGSVPSDPGPTPTAQAESISDAVRILSEDASGVQKSADDSGPAPKASAVFYTAAEESLSRPEGRNDVSPSSSSSVAAAAPADAACAQVPADGQTAAAIAAGQEGENSPAVPQKASPVTPQKAGEQQLKNVHISGDGRPVSADAGKSAYVQVQKPDTAEKKEAFGSENGADQSEQNVFQTQFVRASAGGSTGNVGAADSAKQSAQNAAVQTANAVTQAVKSGRNEMRVHLSPEDLGGITVKIVSRNGALSVQIVADSRHTGQMIENGLGTLHEALQQQGITMDRAEILYTGSSLSGDSGGFQGNNQPYEQSSRGMPQWEPSGESYSPPEEISTDIDRELSVLA